MQNIPVVSIVMSVFNGQEFLAEAIESILCQTHSDFEFIIVNDGSTDASAMILNDFVSKDARVNVIDRDENRGLPYSLNEGIRRARGKYVARMDSDDVAISVRLEKQIRFLESRPEVDIVGSQVCHVDSHGAETSATFQPLSYEDVRSVAEVACPLNHPTFMAKRNAYSVLSGYRETFIYAQDYDLILRALDLGLIIENMPDVLLRYRFRPSETSSAKIHRQLYLARRALALHNERVRLGFESAANFEKTRRSAFYLSANFELSWWLRRKALDSTLPNFWKLLFAACASFLHAEVFFDSLRGLRLKVLRKHRATSR